MLPKVYFTIHRPFHPPKEKEAILNSTHYVYSGITVAEYARVQVRLSCPHYPNAILRIETSDSDNSLEIKASDGVVTIMSGENTEHMLVPDNYTFEVRLNEERYYSYYSVRSKDFSNESLLNLRQYLETLLQGLSYDLIKQRLGMASPVSDMNPSLLQLFQFISKHKNHIRRNFELIMKDPITDLVGEYRITPNSRRPNQKSLRWQAQKGELKNTSLFGLSQYNEKHTQLTIRNLENQWVRYIIKYFLRSIRKLEASFQKEISTVKNKLFDQQKLLELNEKQQKDLGTNAFGYMKTVKNLKGTSKRIDTKINELSNEIATYQKYKQTLREIIYFFTAYENEPWIQMVPIQKPNKITQRLLKDHRYRRLHTLYKELLKLETKHVESNIPGIQFRRTWQLFEYYNVGIMIDILRDNDYRWMDGWLATKDSPYQHIGTLPQDTILRFEKPYSDHYIELAYDTELESNILDKSYSRYFNSAGRRPDIRVTIYKQDGSLYSMKSGLIIESKCRRHRYIINQDIDPDIKLQLKDFKNLEYFDAVASQRGGEPVKTPIKQVIVLYPKQSGASPVMVDHLYGEGMVYIQLEPCDPSSHEKPFGYDSLKEKIDQFLLQVEEGSGENA